MLLSHFNFLNFANIIIVGELSVSYIQSMEQCTFFLFWIAALDCAICSALIVGDPLICVSTFTCSVFLVRSFGLSFIYLLLHISTLFNAFYISVYF